MKFTQKSIELAASIIRDYGSLKVHRARPFGILSHEQYYTVGPPGAHGSQTIGKTKLRFWGTPHEFYIWLTELKIEAKKHL